MSKLSVKDELRREQAILDRLQNVARLIQMETTLTVSEAPSHWGSYMLIRESDNYICSRRLLEELRSEIQLQLLSIVALCYGDNPDIGEPAAMLEWHSNGDYNPEDRFREVWDMCLQWNA